jgi:TolB-like protein
VEPALDATDPEPTPARSQQLATVPPVAAISSEAPVRSSRRRAALVAGVLVALGAIGGLATWRLNSPAATTTTVPQAVRRPSLAVLPIVNVTGDPRRDGVAAQLDAKVRASLSRLSGLTTSTASADVRYVLDGSVRRADGRLRVVATLVDTMTGNAVGNEHFDRPLTNVAAVQHDLVQWIIAAVPITLTEEERAARAIWNPAPAPTVTQPAPARPPRTTVNRSATRPPRANIEATPAANTRQSPTEGPRESPAASPRDSEAVKPAAGPRDDAQRAAPPSTPGLRTSPRKDTPRAAPPPALPEIPQQAS